jgi:quinol monooxygenase YgiN
MGYIRVSIMSPKEGKELEVRGLFEKNIAPAIASAVGLESSDVNVTESGTIVNIESWESEGAWESHRDNVTADAEMVAEFQGLLASFSDESGTSLFTA